MKTETLIKWAREKRPEVPGIIRPIDVVVQTGLSLNTIYRRARLLGLCNNDEPVQFSRKDVKSIIAYKPARSGRKRKP